MVPEIERAPSVLSAEDLAFFAEHGYVRLSQAFPRELALKLQDEIWQEISAEHGIRRDVPSSWKTLPRSPKAAKLSPTNEALADAPFTGAISDLLGHENWKLPATWGGFNVFFPEEPEVRWEVPTRIWHWDGTPNTKGLLIFSVYGDIRPEGGGPLLVEGSPRLIERYYDSLDPEERARPHKHHRMQFSRWDPWLRDLTGQGEPIADRRAAFLERTTKVRGVPCRVVELVGKPGDAWFCDLRMLHCVAPNTSDLPRFLRVKFLFLE